MTTVLVSCKGQIQLPAALRRRLGLGAGTQLELLEESDGLRLRLVRAEPNVDLTALAGLVKAPSRGVPRRLEDFDAGLDFADALHLARSLQASGFVTFDRRLAKRAAPLELLPKVEWLG